MQTLKKLKVLSDSAKYDVACTSNGVDRGASENGGMGNTMACGICHSFSAGGRCTSPLKVLTTNSCVYDCKYCVNRRSDDVPRVTFQPRELVDLAMNFYRRNYIEGLFLSSGILKDPDHTCERMIEALRILYEEYHFNGYIHAKAIPSANSLLVGRLDALADRMSVNIEMPPQESLALFAPDKSKTGVLKPMGFITGKIKENAMELVRYRHTPKSAPTGQNTQMTVGATPDSDFQILKLTEALYQRYGLKRVFFSAYIPVSNDPLLPVLTVKPPLLRKYRLYQAGWLLRFYGFTADELLDEAHQSPHPMLDPKCNWALSHLELFPVDVNRTPYEMTLRVSGIGVKSVRRITTARRSRTPRTDDLKKLGVVMKRVRYFVVAAGRGERPPILTRDAVLRALVSDSCRELYEPQEEQLSLFSAPTPQLWGGEALQCLPGPL